MSVSLPAVGDQFGPWVVDEDAIRICVKCATCGARRRLRLSRLLANRPGRCGNCLSGTSRQERGGESKTPLYRMWATMRHRCGPTAGARTVKRYYARGIRVCEEWDRSYEAFRDWALGVGWTATCGLQLDRRDNSLGYSPENCRFVTPVENVNNRDNTRRVTAWGETKPIAAWVYDPRCVVDYQNLSDRLFRSNGRFTPEQAMTTPRRVRKDNRAKDAGYRPAALP